MTDLTQRITNEFRKMYDETTINGRKLFVLSDTTFFRVGEVSPTGPIVLEYAVDLKSAEKGWLEDGDLFPRNLPFDQLMKELTAEIEDEV